MDDGRGASKWSWVFNEGEGPHVRTGAGGGQTMGTGEGERVCVWRRERREDKD